MTDDSGVSDVTSSSAGDREEEEEEGTTHSGGHVMQEQSRDLADTRSSSSERWAHVSFDLPPPPLPSIPASGCVPGAVPYQSI